MTQSTTRSTPDISGKDRERARAERGLRSSGAAAAAFRDSLPSPPRRRRPAMAALAVLLIVGGAALAGLLALRLDAREPVLVVNQDVVAGEKITVDMLSQTDVASDGLMLIPVEEAEEVLGTYARAPITRGQLLDTSMLTTADPIGDDRAMVGVPLAGGRVPPGLRSGDEVRVMRLGDGSDPAAAITTALVVDTTRSEADSLSGGGGGTTGTLLVPADAADAVVDAAGNDLLGLSLLRRGVAVDDADLTVLSESRG